MTKTPYTIGDKTYFTHEEKKMSFGLVALIIFTSLVFVWSVIGVARIWSVAEGKMVAPNPMFVI